jgi:hypothetical protein
MVIKHGKNKKAAGPDNIYIEYLKESIESTQDLWVNLMNKCLKTGEVPESWKTATMKILYKGKGDTSNPDSFRGIVLQNTTFKLFTRILNERLLTMVDQHIPECQFGFRKGRSTLQAVTYLLTQIEDALRHPRGKYYTVSVDFKKAFDMIRQKNIDGKTENNDQK